jgi:hypothetical protein
VLPGYRRGRLCPFYLPVLPLYGFTKFYTNPFLLIYLLLNFKLPVLILIGCLEQKKTKSVLPHILILDVCGLQVNHTCQTCSIVHSLYKRYNNLLIRMRELIAVLDEGPQSRSFQCLLLQLPQAGLRFHLPHGLLLAFVLNCLLKISTFS